MHPNLIACNATNSAAVDNEGKIWVWGAGKYGLLGDHSRDVNYQVPKPLKISTSGNSADLVASRDAFTRAEQAANYRVRDIAMGLQHIVVIAVDSDFARKQFKMMTYAQDIFKKMREHLIQFFFPMECQRYLNDHELNELDDHKKVEHCLKKIFSDDRTRFPQAKWVTLYNFLFKQL